MTPERRVLGLLIAANVLWAPVNLMIKVGTEGGFTPIGLAAMRWMTLSVVMGACLTIPAFRRMSEAQFPNRKDGAKAILLGLCLFGPTHAIYYTALQKTSSVEGNVLGTTAPIWVAVLSFLFLRERPTSTRLLAIGIGFVGAYIVSVGFGPPALRGGHTEGNLLYTIGVFTESIVGVGAAALIRRSSGITILWLQVVGAGLFYTIATPFLRTVLAGPISAQNPFSLSWEGSVTNSPLTWPALGALAYLIFVAGMFNFGVWYTIVKKAPLSWMTITLLLQPPVTAVLGWYFLHERLTNEVWAGSFLILIALGIGMLKSKEKPSDLVAPEA